MSSYGFMGTCATFSFDDVERGKIPRMYPDFFAPRQWMHTVRIRVRGNGFDFLLRFNVDHMHGASRSVPDKNRVAHDRSFAERAWVSKGENQVFQTGEGVMGLADWNDVNVFFSIIIERVNGLPLLGDVFLRKQAKRQLIKLGFFSVRAKNSTAYKDIYSAVKLTSNVCRCPEYIDLVTSCW
jgi:hypothetical protein